MKRGICLLLCALLACATAAQADMTAANDTYAVYIGEGSQLFMEGASAPIATEIVADVVFAQGGDVCYLAVASVGLDSVPRYALKHVSLSSLAVDTVAEEVLHAVYIPLDRAMYYVTADQPSRIMRKSYGGAAGDGDFTVEGTVESLQYSLLGLVVTHNGADKLYGEYDAVDIAAREQGARYTVAGVEYEALLMPDGALWIRTLVPNATVQVGENVIALAYDRALGRFFFLQDQQSVLALCVYDSGTRTSKTLGTVADARANALAASNGMVYMLTADNRLCAYNALNGDFRYVDSLEEYGLVEPTLEFAGGSVLVYDVVMGVKMYVASAQATGGAELPAAQQGDSYTELKRGSRGDAVERLQMRLIDLKYLLDEADGIFGALTESAVKLLQGDLGMAENGVASVEFQKRIYTTVLQPLDVYAELAKGAKGTNVKKMQQRLRDLYYMASSADGEFGGMTKTAVERYQEQNGFRASGIATEDMLIHLYSASATKCAGYIDLRKNDSGTLVKNLNARLRELYYTSEAIGSSYNNATVAAVKLFQAEIGETQTGNATKALQERLFSEYAPQYSGYVNHYEGESGARIAAAQVRLSALGYLRADCTTGALDALTVQAVRDFQYENRIAVDGALTSDTQSALFGPAVLAPSFLTAEQSAAYLARARSYISGALSDEDVLALLQERLISLRFLSDKAVAGGMYNRLTFEAVKRLQMAYGLVDVSVSTANLGIMDAAVVDALVDGAASVYTGIPAYYYQ